MKLTDLHIDDFGALRSLSLSNLPPTFFGVYGPNGSGKTTLMYLLRGALGDKSDAAAASLWQQSDRHCGSIGVQRSTGVPSESVTIRGGLKTKRELLGADGVDERMTAASARLSTLIASEAVDSASLIALADRLGLDLVTERRDRDAEERYQSDRDSLQNRVATLAAKIAAGERDRNETKERLRRLRSEWQATFGRLRQQRSEVQAAVSSADAVTDARHLDYQATQCDRQEWQDEAWRPRRARTVARHQRVAEPVSGPRNATIARALSEIARLRCEATARLNRGLVNEIDHDERCHLHSEQIRRLVARLQVSVQEGVSTHDDLTRLSALLERSEEANSWLRADRAIALLDRCQRDLLLVRGTLAESACVTETCREPSCPSHRTSTTQAAFAGETREVLETVIDEPNADFAVGERLAVEERQARHAWQNAARHGVQVRRHLAAIEAKLRNLIEPDFASIESDIERLTASIAAWIAELTATEAELARLVEPTTRRPNAIMTAASDYFRRMTCSHYNGLRLKDRKKDRPRLVAMTRADNAIDARTLSRGTAGQASLALRLAMLDALGSQSRPTPLLLDDALVDSDHERMHAGISVLRDWASARSGRQVMLLSCQRQLIEAMHAQRVELRCLPGGQPLLDELTQGRPNGSSIARTAPRPAESEAASERPAPAPVTFVTSAPLATPLVERSTEPATLPVVTFAADTVETEPAGVDPFEVEPANATGPIASGSCWLQSDSPLGLLESIDSVTARRLATLDLDTADDLILADSELLESRLLKLQISVEQFRRWQAEADLLVTVPSLAPRDARLLVLIGVCDAEALAGLSVAELAARIDTLRHSSAGRGFAGDWDGLSSQRMASWIERARHRTGRTSATRSMSTRTIADRSSGVRPSRSGSKRQSRGSDGLSVMERRQKNRGSKRDRREAEAAATEWKHYLHKSSPVVDAPSIGPKMAKRLAKCGIKTVGDLLKSDAAKVAKQLDDRRITADTVNDWMDQSRLMCRIPLLRGHDAQVLVACGFRDVSTLEGRSARNVFAKVGPFVATKEGQRLLRSSRTPDLEEVTDWLSWAEHARSLKAA